MMGGRFKSPPPLVFHVYLCQFYSFIFSQKSKLIKNGQDQILYKKYYFQFFLKIGRTERLLQSVKDYSFVHVLLHAK